MWSWVCPQWCWKLGELFFIEGYQLCLVVFNNWLAPSSWIFSGCIVPMSLNVLFIASSVPWSLLSLSLFSSTQQMPPDMDVFQHSVLGFLLFSVYALSEHNSFTLVAVTLTWREMDQAAWSLSWGSMVSLIRVRL